jgi:hypothetical protein
MDEAHMQSLHSAAVSIEADNIQFPFECPTNDELENRVVSPCGRFESFDYKGNHFEVDWDEIVGDPQDEGMPHEQFMEELDRFIEELEPRTGSAK